MEPDMPDSAQNATIGDAGWRAAADSALKGMPYETLVSRLIDGVEIQPIHPLTYGSKGRALRQKPGGWTILQRVDVPEIRSANALLLADLAGGAGGIDLVFSTSAGAHGAGLAVETSDDAKALLEGVLLEMVRVRLNAGAAAPETAALILSYLLTSAERQGIDPTVLTLDAGLDPIGAFAVFGRLDTSYAEMKARVTDAVQGLKQANVGGTWLTADGRPVHAAGGSEAQELAFALASAIAYLRLCEDAGIDLDQAKGRIEVALVADEDVFVSTAKLRAMRLVWDRALSVLGSGPVPLPIHAETSWRSMARRDPHVNILRAASGVAAAAFSGAESVTVLPFSLALGLPDGFARRIARNTQSVLLEEAGLGRVLDPAAGAGHVEALSGELAQRAWDDFREMEAEGGVVTALRSGAFQNTVATLRDMRLNDVIHGRTKLTGVNAFPSLEQPEPSLLDVNGAGEVALAKPIVLPDPGGSAVFSASMRAVGEGASLTDLLAARPKGEDRITPIHPIRLASDFEELCDAADAVTSETGTRPAVFLVPLGKLATYSARATWAANLLATGGLDAKFSDSGYDDPADAVAAAIETGAAFAVLCGSDASYAEQAEEFATALFDSGVSVWLAGRPGAMEEGLRAAGVSDFIFEGCDMLAMVRRAHRLLGVSVSDDV